MHNNVQFDRLNDAFRRKRAWLWFSCWKRTVWIFWLWIVFSSQWKWNQMNQNMCRFNMIWFVFINVWLKCFSIINSFESELFCQLHEKLICYWYKKCQRLNWNWNQRYFWWWKQIVLKNDYVINIVRNTWSVDKKHVNQRHDQFDRKRF